MRTRRQNGFSLIELMIALTISSFVSGGIYRILRSQVQSESSQRSASANTRATQMARALLTNDLAGAGFDPRQTDLGRSPITPFIAAGNDRFTVQGDFNLSGRVGDQTAGENPETIGYLFDAASSLVTRNGSPFLEKVSAFSVTYYDAPGASTTSVPDGVITSLSKIKKVRVAWSYAGGGGISETQEVVVRLRNYRGS
jgi:prepilin-type N-terminal cleavage/methylation domain-containing protein